MPVSTPQNAPRVGGYAPNPTYNANTNYANGNYANPNQVITPMPVQGMPNAQTYAPQGDAIYYPPQGEVVYGGQPMMTPEASIVITPASPEVGDGTAWQETPSQSAQPTASAQPATPVISDEVMELSRPVHIEIGKGVSHEIIETD